MNRKEKLKKNAEKRVREITTQAKAVFLKKGYYAGTVEEIARLAGVSKGTVFTYFKNKDELYISLVLDHLEEYARLLREFRAEFSNGKYASGKAVIMEFCKLYLALYEHDPEVLRILQTYMLQNVFVNIGGVLEERLLSIYKEVREISEEIISESVELGLLPKVNPRQLAIALMGTFLGIVQLEQRKFSLTKRDHLLETLGFCFSLIADGLSGADPQKASVGPSASMT